MISESVEKHKGDDETFRYMGGNFLRNQAVGHAVKLWANRGPVDLPSLFRTADKIVKYIDEGEYL